MDRTLHILLAAVEGVLGYIILVLAVGMGIRGSLTVRVVDTSHDVAGMYFAVPLGIVGFLLVGEAWSHRKKAIKPAGND